MVETLAVVSYGTVGIGYMGAHGTFPECQNVLILIGVLYIGVYVCQNLLSCTFHCMSVFHLNF